MGVATNASQGKVDTAYRTGASDNIGISSPAGVYIGVVKRNDDNQEMGRLKVYIQEFGGNPENEESWISVSYASPFAGSTSIYDQGANVESYDDTIKSYGMWMVPPDIDTRVLVAFANGKIDKGYWFACLFQRGTQVSIPGIPSRRTYDGENIPAAPKNKRDQDPDNKKYVTHKPMYDALKKQGLEKDTLRGTSSSSVTRESPSKVMGILTPGQHQFVLDDGDKNGVSKLIRLRTTNGVQLLLDDTGGHVYLISKNGESWIELSADGQIHLYGSKDINIRSETNVNIRADKDVNIEAGNNVNIKAVSDNVQLEAGTDITTLATSDTKITSQGTSNINSQVAHYETAGTIHMNGPAAATADAVTINTLAVNQGLTESICKVVPEHEPWAGHAGSINPVGPGNIQMKKDPVPDQSPRAPSENDTGAQMCAKPEAPPEYIDVKTANISEKMISVIKDQNGYTPVAVEDAGGESVGYGSELTAPPDVIDLPEVEEPDTVLYIEDIEQGMQDNPMDSVTSAAQSVTAPLISATGQAKNVFDSVNNNLNQAASGVNSFQNKLADAAAAASVTGANILNKVGTTAAQAAIRAQGTTVEQANQMLNRELSKSVKSVKSLLTGVERIPGNTFDGLVSFHNQTGDASYVYTNNEKIDLRPLLKNQEWDRVAGLIAADERNRSRRILEAGIMTTGNYGQIPDSTSVVSKGMQKTNELLLKGKLNQQSGAPATTQQIIAASSGYFATTGKMLPNLSFPAKLNVMENATKGASTFIKNQIGGWPY
jgi:hypothetical protein